LLHFLHDNARFMNNSRTQRAGRKNEKCNFNEDKGDDRQQMRAGKWNSPSENTCAWLARGFCVYRPCSQF